MRNNWLGLIFFSPGDSHTKQLLVLLYPDLKGVTEVDCDPKRRLGFFKVTRSNHPSGHNTREQLAKGLSLKGYRK